MDYRSEKIPYDQWPIPEELMEKLKRSEEEAKGKEMREIKCPRCGRLLCYVTKSEGNGPYEKRKCPRCKLEFTMNLSYFHRRVNKGGEWLTELYLGNNKR